MDTALTDAVLGRFPGAVPARLPQAAPDLDSSAAFAALRASVQGAAAALFDGVRPGALDSFFRLRLSQAVRGQPPEPALSVIVLADDPGGAPLAGGFADRFRSGWPFARCVFVSDREAPRLGLPVWQPGRNRPEVLASGARAGQPIAVQIQIAWGRCGSTTVFENQVESLVRAGWLTLRLFWEPRLRRGPTLSALLDRILPENGANAGAHADLLAVPDGPPPFDAAAAPEQAWARWLTESAGCLLADADAAAAARIAEYAVANHLDTVGAALFLSPASRLLLEAHDDQARAERAWLTAQGAPADQVEAAAAAAWQAQAAVLAIPDVCAHVSLDEARVLGPLGRSPAVVVPRPYARPAAGTEKRHDVLIAADAHPANVASLRWFLQEVWQAHLRPHGVRVAVAGRAGLQADAAGRDAEGLHVLGFVEDLEGLRAACRLSVVPDRDGTGVSVKLLTALAAGHPVATTGTGLRGLPPEVARELPAQDGAAAFAADIIALLRDPALLQARAAASARAHAAILAAPGHAELLAGVPAVDAAAIARRQAQWAALAARRPDPGPPFRFDGERAFPMSGSSADPQVLGNGWHEAEPWGRWMDGAEAHLRLPVDAPQAEPMVLELDIQPCPAGGRLGVRFDGSAADPVWPSNGPTRWALPTGGATEVTLLAERTVRPADNGSTDTRVLGAGVRSVRVRRAAPVAAAGGVRVRLTSAADPGTGLVSGWHPAERWGCWTNGPEAEAWLRFPAPLAGAQVLGLHLAPPPAPQPVAVLVNGVPLEVRPVTDGLNEWALPPAATEGLCDLRLRFRVAMPVRPSDIGLSGDDRLLGVGVRYVVVRPA